MKYAMLFIGLFLPAIFNPASAGGLSEYIRFIVENKPEGDRYRIDETRLFPVSCCHGFTTTEFLLRLRYPMLV